MVPHQLQQTATSCWVFYLGLDLRSRCHPGLICVRHLWHCWTNVRLRLHANIPSLSFSLQNNTTKHRIISPLFFPILYMHDLPQNHVLIALPPPTPKQGKYCFSPLGFEFLSIYLLRLKIDLNRSNRSLRFNPLSNYSLFHLH